MKKIVKIKESELVNLIDRIITESTKNVKTKKTVSKRKPVVNEGTKLRNFIKQVIESEIKNRFRMLSEQWNPSDNYIGDYYIATSPMDEPGEVKVHVISQEEVNEYDDNGWDIDGPYNKKEANIEYERIQKSNADFRYYDKMDDEEGKSNLYINPNDKFERGSLDKNW